MTATDRGRRSDALYYDNVGMQRRRLCDMVANLESDNAELREQMDGLVSSLRNDWQIEASWDGLRRFWYIGWTDEHVESCAECAKGLGAYADSLCDTLKAENAKLCEELEAAKHDLSLFSGELVASKLENARLRELVREAIYARDDADWASIVSTAIAMGVEVDDG